MCGIAGVLDPTTRPTAEWHSLLANMARCLERRGPDGEGTWVDESAGIGFAHRRLAIVDLSPTGAQPMVSASGRYVIVLNGEIYDHRRWRRDLETAGTRFRGTSDTEVLLAAIEQWGLRRTLERVNGMFALALWDSVDRRLTLARDRMGEKPLYYTSTGDDLAFASRLTSLQAVPSFAGELDRDAVASYLRFGFLTHPQSIVSGVAQLGPGCLLEATTVDGRIVLRHEQWWQLDNVVVPPQQRQHVSLEEFEAALTDAVALRLQADVPTGAFLSGGIDSSLIAALGQQSVGLRTFTVAVGDAALDESARAAAIAQHLGTQHTTIELGSVDVLAAVNAFFDAYDEPFADPSSLPTMLLCSEVRRHVTVALGGDGSDELFAGYNRHVIGTRAWSRLGYVPAPLRVAGGWLLGSVSPDVIDRAGATASRLRRRTATPHLSDKVAKFANLMTTKRSAGPWAALAPVWGGNLPWTQGASPGLPRAPKTCTSALDQLRWLDTSITLPDDMLTKVDRASMHASLETRLPFLDPEVVSLAWRLPKDQLVNGRQGKVLVRQLLGRHLPAALIEGPKRGFDPPLAEWLRGPLRGWANERLAPGRLRATGWLEPAPIQAVWQEHLSRRANHDYRLWTILVFVEFLARWGRQ